MDFRVTHEKEEGRQIINRNNTSSTSPTTIMSHESAITATYSRPNSDSNLISAVEPHPHYHQQHPFSAPPPQHPPPPPPPSIHKASPSSSLGTTADSNIELELTSHLQERRRKRLERNRESARLSRQKRKQFLGELEENVCNLSLQMDKNRRKHVFESLSRIRALRNEILQDEGDLEDIDLQVLKLVQNLSRTSEDLRIACIFLKEQLKSMAVPNHERFLLWLTLQNDNYFRGGRATSERLSAARIGERMLQSGNDTVSTCNGGMWPLFCHEIALSYDQEERVRCIQQKILLKHASWVDRHTEAASMDLISSIGKCLNSSLYTVRNREKLLLSSPILSNTQKFRFLSWTNNNKSKIQKFICNKIVKEKNSNISSQYHQAANLYNINRVMTNVFQKLPIYSSPIISSKSLKRLGFRPSFESLSNVSSTNSKDSLNCDSPTLSSASLKRPSSSISNENLETQSSSSNIAPDLAQIAATPHVTEMLKPAGVIPRSLNDDKISPTISVPQPPPAPLSPYPTCLPEEVSSKPHHLHKQQQLSPVAHFNNACYPHTQMPAPVYQPQPMSYQYTNSPQHQPQQPQPLPIMPNIYYPPPPQQSQLLHQPSPISIQTTVGTAARSLPIPMKSVPEESEIPSTSYRPTTHTKTPSTIENDILLDLAEDWTIEGFDIELPPMY